MIKYILALLLFTNISYGQTYRFMPLRPVVPPALNNTISPQLANQNINFTFPAVSGTISYTQINTPQLRINQLYGLGNFGYVQQNNISFLPNYTTPSGYNPFANQYYQMATSYIGGNNFNYYNFGYQNINYQGFSNPFNNFTNSNTNFGFFWR